MKTVDAVRGRWPEIFQYYGLPPVTGNKHWPKECPICGKKGKFRIDDKGDERGGNGTFICSCNQGDGWRLLELTQNKPFRILADEIDALLGNEYQKEAKPTPAQKTDIQKQREKVISKYASLTSLRGTDAERYLQSRGINCLPSENIRYCDHQRAQGKIFQAIYALATDDKGKLCYLHRTLLDGDRKASILEPKKTLGQQEGNYLSFASSVAIRMFPVASTLGIAEGIETALSCKQIYGVNTWSTINAGFMEKFRAPMGVKNLIIFADMDKNSATGHAAAFACARGNLNAINDLEKVTIRWPDNGDFNDMLINGDQVREQIFLKKKKEAA